MAIAFIPWVAGAVIGGVAAYLYKDEHVRDSVSRTTGDISDKMKGAADAVTEKVTGSVNILRDKLFGKSVEEIAPVAPKKTATRKRTTAKTATKKKAVKRTTARKRAAKKPTAAAA